MSCVSIEFKQAKGMTFPELRGVAKDQRLTFVGKLADIKPENYVAVAGHGGRDVGAVYVGEREKLAEAKLLHFGVVPYSTLVFFEYLGINYSLSIPHNRDATSRFQPLSTAPGIVAIIGNNGSQTLEQLWTTFIYDD